ncbi:MAG: bifunctional serine/threonine-protein kinase/formylglycine-generating enzyme family protein [Snowella sp.]|nr:bifunctional serine/threonine-protein kinase/formylglycine-generating enzyme family protein [Snowella sp.]
MNALLFGMMQGQQIGQYHLETLLGAGGFGGVFRASEVVRDQVLRQLAIKIIPGNSPQQLEELIAAANLEHEHLIRSYSAGECTILNTEMLYLAMELAESSLDRRFEQGNFQSSEIRQILTEVVSALAYLHGQKQVHRDLKPANILRAKNRWKLSDFGLVKRLDSRSYAQTSNPIGTIAYMPPEAFEGNISAAWDMWSLGIMLVQMVTNRLPYQFNEPTQLLKRVMNCELNLPSLPDEFKPIILGCLQKDRQRRWTANQVLSALQPPVIQFATPQVSPSPRPAISASPQVLTLNLPGNVKLEMIKIPAGSFLMGSTEAEVKRLNQEYSTDWHNCELSQHRVTLQEYYLGKYPVTQEQYQAVMGNNPSYFKDNPKNPVETVSWNDAKAFCQEVYEITGQKVRLATEAEWEYGCRAGTTTPFYFGETISTEQANYHGNYTFGQGEKGICRQKTTPVGSFPANKFGLYDMHSNVCEWCEDSWHENYKEKPETLRQNGSIIWSSSNEHRRVLRGGTFDSTPKDCRSAVRSRNNADRWNNCIGFRLALGSV